MVYLLDGSDFELGRNFSAAQVLCQMFNRAIRGQTRPNYLSTDHDP
jgi:hypothetical protein